MIICETKFSELCLDVQVRCIPIALLQAQQEVGRDLSRIGLVRLCKTERNPPDNPMQSGMSRPFKYTYTHLKYIKDVHVYIQTETDAYIPRIHTIHIHIHPYITYLHEYTHIHTYRHS